MWDAFVGPLLSIFDLSFWRLSATVKFMCQKAAHPRRMSQCVCTGFKVFKQEQARVMVSQTDREPHTRVCKCMNKSLRYV